jgi:hypothetical protein
MDDLKIEYVPISSIKAYENNAKIHTDEQIEQIKASIKEFGMCDPVGVWHDEIVEGHGRIIALKKLGADKVPIIRLDSLTDEQRRAYMLVHNKLNMNTDFDAFKLDVELQGLPDFDSELYGFDIDTFDNSFIDDLENEAVATRNNNQLETFEISLAFPKEKETEIKDWLKIHSRETMVDIILREIDNA